MALKGGGGVDERGLRPRPLRLRLVVTKPTESAANALNYLKYFPYALPCERGQPVGMEGWQQRVRGEREMLAWIAGCLACHTVAIQIKYFNILLAAAAAAALGRIPRCV